MKLPNRFDINWILSLFGTAVGAGILFLPIRAGTGGVFPVIMMTVLIFPMVWLSHRALSRFVCATNDEERDITHVAEDFWGRKIGMGITVLYFFAIYPIVLTYGVGMTNTFESFFIHQLDWQSLYETIHIRSDDKYKEIKQLLPHIRAIMALVLVGAMMAVMFLKEELITKICSAFVYPLCLVLLGFSIYLIPHWKILPTEYVAEAINISPQNIQAMVYIPSFKDFWVIVWLTLPVLVFSFNYSPAISTFSKSMMRHYGKNAPQKASEILCLTSLLLLVFVMFFVFSCILCLDTNDFSEARRANIPILSYFANKLDNPIIGYGAPLVAFLAILTSFFGHYFGAVEGLNGIIRKALKSIGVKSPNTRAIHAFTTIFMFVSIVVVSYVNPSILDFIESLGGPIIAAILFIMPIIALYSVETMKKWRNKWLDIFVFVTGIITISSVIYKFF